MWWNEPRPLSSQPSGEFRFEPGSYGGPGGYVPSLACFSESASGQKEYRFVLANQTYVVDSESEAAADPGVLEDTHEEWRRQAQEKFSELGRQGLRIERVEIDVDELIAWCAEQKRALDGLARAEFTSRKLRQKYEEKG